MLSHVVSAKQNIITAFSIVLSLAVLQQSDQYFQENEAGLCATSITDPESLFRVEGHDVPITAASAPSVFRHVLVFSAMCSVFVSACHRVWGTGDERLMTSERPHLTPACALCGS